MLHSDIVENAGRSVVSFLKITYLYMDYIHRLKCAGIEIICKIKQIFFFVLFLPFQVVYECSFYCNFIVFSCELSCTCFALAFPLRSGTILFAMVIQCHVKLHVYNISLLK